jgi:hypothetical protein
MGKGKGLVLSGPNPFFSSGLCVLCVLCENKLASYFSFLASGFLTSGLGSAKESAGTGWSRR